VRLLALPGVGLVRPLHDAASSGTPRQRAVAEGPRGRRKRQVYRATRVGAERATSAGRRSRTPCRVRWPVLRFRASRGSAGRRELPR
jgi:hypothetical protein